MSRNTRRTERHRRKRQEKHRSQRRAEGGSPHQRIGRSGQVVACYVNSEWRDDGKAGFYCLCKAPGGGYAMASFLVDLWCMGLKDAWGHLDITASEFRETFVDRASEVMEMERVDPEVVRRIVAGGIRFAEQNGFRLPKRYDRWTAMLGIRDASDQADLAEFGIEGKLRFVGTLDDLRKRLIGTTPDAFLRREDVNYVIEDGDFSLWDDEYLEAEETYDDVKSKALDAIRRWCFAGGLEPHPLLPEAWDVLFESIMLATDPDDDSASTQPDIDEVAASMGQIVSADHADAEQGIADALEQWHAFMVQFPTPEELNEAIGFDVSTQLPQ